MKAFSTLLKPKDSDIFEWHAKHQEAFMQIKVSLTTQPVLVLIHWMPSCTRQCARIEQAIFYLSQNLNPPKINYFAVEKLCFALFFATSKLRHYMLPSITQVIAQIDVIHYMLTRPIVKGQISEWTMALYEFSLQYVPQKAVKGQALANFLAQHLSPYEVGGNDVEIGMPETRDNYWTMYFDGSSTSIPHS
ncbi:hypothetical protein ACFX2K_013689 [Malus domestica]